MVDEAELVCAWAEGRKAYVVFSLVKAVCRMQKRLLRLATQGGFSEKSAMEALDGSIQS